MTLTPTTTTPTILLASDLHLEKRDDNARAVILQKINQVIARHRLASPYTEVIVVLAGDIGEGLMGVDWALNIVNATVVYVAGNHEFWGEDYDTLINALQARSQNTHVHFLHNREITLHGIRFAGTTLWTNLGGDIPGWRKKNPAIIASASYMRDFQRITYKKWYDSSENLLKLKETLIENPLLYDSLINEKKWNPLIELEENAKSKYFIQERLSFVNKELKEPLVFVFHHLPLFQSFYERGFDRSALRTISSREHLLNETMRGRGTFRTDVLRLACYANNLEAIFSHRHAPVLIVHGHFHVPVDYVHGRTRVASNPFGYQWDTQTEDFRMLAVRAEPPIAALANNLNQSLDWGADWLARWGKTQEGIKEFAKSCESYPISESAKNAFAYAMSDHAEQLTIEANQEMKKCLQPFVRFFHPEIEAFDLPSLKPEEWVAYSKVFLIASEDHLGLPLARFSWLHSPMISVSQHSFDTPYKFNLYAKEEELSPSWEHYANWLKEMSALTAIFQQNLQTLKDFCKILPEQCEKWEKPWPLRPYLRPYCDLNK